MVYVGIMGMTRAVWVGQERDGLPGLIARTASGNVLSTACYGCNAYTLDF